jgi:hypothetical protein
MIKLVTNHKNKLKHHKEDFSEKLPHNNKTNPNNQTKTKINHNNSIIKINKVETTNIKEEIKTLTIIIKTIKVETIIKVENLSITIIINTIKVVIKILIMEEIKTSIKEEIISIKIKISKKEIDIKYHELVSI